MDTENNEDETLVLEFQDLEVNNVEFTKKCSMIAKDVQCGTYSILQLIEQLKVLLISNSPSNREKGMTILSNVLETLPVNFLSSEQLSVISVFYSERLNDHHQVIPSVLKGVLVLSNYKDVPEGTLKQILNSLFQNVPCQQQQQSDRLIIYKILKLSLDNRLTEVLQMGFDYVYGVISAMDGERDPRNLLFLFNWLPKYLRKIPLGHLAEEMFEVMACYFPVDFRAPTQDPDSISRDTLAEALCKCLCAIPEFAEYCLPLALDKLSSSLRIAKLDSLNLIAEGCKTFEVPAYIQHSTDIWSQIQREVLQCSDEELEKAALATLETVLNKLSKTTPDIYKPILSDITDTLKGNLLPSQKLFMQSSKIIYHTAKSSSVAADYVTTEIVPLLINTCKITTTPAHQVLLFKSLIDLVKVYIATHRNHNLSAVQELSSVPNLCIQAILQEDNEVRAVGLTSLAILSKSLPEEIRNHIYEYFRVCIITPQPIAVYEAALECFTIIAQTYSQELKQNVVSKIEINNKEQLKLYMDFLIGIANIEDFRDYVLSFISEHCFSDVETVTIATGTLKNLLETYENETEIHRFLIESKQFIPETLNWLKSYINIIDTSKHKVLLQNIAEILKILIGHEPSNTQCMIVNNNLEGVVLLYEKDQNPALVIILSGLLTQIRPDVKVVYDVFDHLLNCCINCKDNYVQGVAVQLLANLLNKDSQEQHLQTRLIHISNTCNRVLNETNCKITINNVINIISWVTKALVMRGHVESNNWTSRLLDLLNSHEEAARSFKTIICDSYDCLGAKSYSNKRLLYQQKFFVEVSQKLSENFNGGNYNYLLAIGYLIQEVPKKIFILQFNKILRLVIMCLELCEDEYILFALLEALNDLIEAKEQFMERHIQEFLPRFLTLTNFTKCMKVRIKALQCIQNYATGFPVYKLLLHKQDILQGLTRCLDDRKRLVRKEAVDARNRWFIIDAPI